MVFQQKNSMFEDFVGIQHLSKARQHLKESGAEWHWWTDQNYTHSKECLSDPATSSPFWVDCAFACSFRM
jgi:hypothetical protein